MSHPTEHPRDGQSLLSTLRSAYEDDVHEALDAVLRHHVVQLRGEVAELAAPPPVADALEHICGRLYDPDLNVNAVLEEIGDPAPSFRSAFRCHVGLPPRRFIEANRLIAARRAMADTGASCFVVSYRVGYAYYRTFARAFKRFFGHTPGGEASRSKAHGLEGRRAEVIRPGRRRNCLPESATRSVGSNDYIKWRNK